MTDRHRRTFPAPRGLHSAEALASQPRAVVVGAGIAGLAAATGLAERGVAVDVVEREEYLGGRVGGWTERFDGAELAMNRGFHAFFRQYYNLRALLSRVDPTLSMLTAVDDYPLIDGDGRQDTFRGLPRTPPWNALVFALRSPTFRLTDLARIDARAAAPLAAVSLPDIFNRLDHIDAETFLKSINFPEAARHLAFEVFSRSFFASPADLSAAELATMFHIYFLGSSEGLIFDVANANYDTALWNPLQQYLEGLGVRFHQGSFGDAASAVSQNQTFRVQTDAGDQLDADAVVLATDIGGLQRIVEASPGLVRRHVAGANQAAAHGPAVLGAAAVARPAGGSATEPRFSAPPATNRSTTSASWNATNAKLAEWAQGIRWFRCRITFVRSRIRAAKQRDARSSARAVPGDPQRAGGPRTHAAAPRLPAVRAGHLRTPA